MADRFWTDAALEPKRGYRFLVTLGNMPNGASYYVKSVNKPGIKVTSKEHKYLGHNFWYPGMVEWQNNPTEIKLIDPVSPDASAHLSAILQASGYTVPNNPNRVTTISKKAAVDALGGFVVKQINESHGDAGLTGGQAVETWTFHNAFIEEIAYGELAYDKEDLTELTLKIRWDWATLETLNPVTNSRVIQQLGDVIVDGDTRTRFK